MEILKAIRSDNSLKPDLELNRCGSTAPPASPFPPVSSLYPFLYSRLCKPLLAALVVLITGSALAEAPGPEPEIEYSVYDVEMLEPMVTMARRMQEAGRHPEAVELFDRAWQMSRVSNGLYHEEQVALIEAMIFSELELRDWESVNKRYSYLEHLYRRLYAIDDPRLELGLRKISSWHINAVNLNLDGRRIQHLRKAHSILKARLEIAELTLEDNHPRFDFLQESIIISEQQLYLASDINRGMLRSRALTNRGSLLAGLE